MARVFLFLFIFLTSVSNVNANLTSDLEFLTKAKLNKYARLKTYCDLYKDTHCDSFLYHATILETHFEYLAKNYRTEIDYLNKFIPIHPKPNAVCLNDGFWICFGKSLESSLRHAWMTELDCKKETSAKEDRKKIQAELQALSKACHDFFSGEERKCFIPEPGLMGDKPGLFEKRNLTKAESGYQFYQLDNDWIQKNKCEREHFVSELGAERRRLADVGDISSCHQVSAECIPRYDEIQKKFISVAEATLKVAPLEENEVALELKKRIESLADDVGTKEEKNYLTRIIKDQGFLHKQARSYLKTHPRKKSEVPLSQLNRILDNYEQVLKIELARIPKKPVIKTAPKIEPPKPEDFKIVKEQPPKKSEDFGPPSPPPADPSEFVPELSSSQGQEAAKPWSKEMVEDKAYDALHSRALLDPTKATVNPAIGDLLFEYEMAETKDLSRYRILKTKWLNHKKEYQGFVSFLRKNKYSEEKILEEVVGRLNRTYTKNYFREKRMMTDYLERMEANCDGRTRFVFSTLSALDIKPSGGKIFAVEHFRNHVQPVLYDPVKGETQTLDVGVNQKQKGKILRPEILLFTMTRGKMVEAESVGFDHFERKDLVLKDEVKDDRLQDLMEKLGDLLKIDLASVFLNYGESDATYDDTGAVRVTQEFRTTLASLPSLAPAAMTEEVRAAYVEAKGRLEKKMKEAEGNRQLLKTFENMPKDIFLSKYFSSDSSSGIPIRSALKNIYSGPSMYDFDAEYLFSLKKEKVSFSRYLQSIVKEIETDPKALRKVVESSYTTGFFELLNNAGVDFDIEKIDFKRKQPLKTRANFGATDLKKGTPISEEVPEKEYGVKIVFTDRQLAEFDKIFIQSQKPKDKADVSRFLSQLKSESASEDAVIVSFEKYFEVFSQYSNQRKNIAAVGAFTRKLYNDPDFLTEFEKQLEKNSRLFISQTLTLSFNPHFCYDLKKNLLCNSENHVRVSKAYEKWRKSIQEHEFSVTDVDLAAPPQKGFGEKRPGFGVRIMR